MPNTKSAIRRVRRVKKQTQVNRIRKSKYKNAIKQMELLLNSKEKDKAKKYFPPALLIFSVLSIAINFIMYHESNYAEYNYSAIPITT